MGAISGLKIKGVDHWERKKSYFSRISSSKVDTSTQDKSDQWPILHISSNFISGKASFYPFDAHCCHVGINFIKHPVPERVKPSFAILTSNHARRFASECPDVKNYKWRLNPVWHKMLYSCTQNYPYGNSGRQNVNKNKLQLTESYLLT